MAWSLTAELERIRSRPGTDADRPLLASFVVDVDLPGPASLDTYARRIRSAVRAGVAVAASADFDADADLPEEEVPEWFTAAGADSRYVSARGQEAWTTQDWLLAFDPTMRQWEWWDITAAGGNSVQIWLDARGESFFPAEDVRWLAYTAGASSVAGPITLPRLVWEGQTSIGLEE